ncbi:hypothetical protein OFAG_02308 [Oxalobacter formigenes HOxBLS]|uniref:Uncharacterized protein n=1 Tax=Oxalobacter paraformigenes TaxID=556268 RepID=T5LQC8_9BURK|nr:hypothetical protein OFAG_02308 [Oxalobacter paraformigenes]
MARIFIDPVDIRVFAARMVEAIVPFHTGKKGVENGIATGRRNLNADRGMKKIGSGLCTTARSSQKNTWNRKSTPVLFKHCFFPAVPFLVFFRQFPVFSRA